MSGRAASVAAAACALFLSLHPAVAATPDCTPPRLWGDGEHDDTLALNAWLRGDTVVWADTDKEVGPVIDGHTFRLSDAIYVQSGTGRRLEHFRLVWPARGETVSGAEMQAGDDPDQPPKATALNIQGGDSSEGVAFDAPDPSPAEKDKRSRCLTS